MLQTKMRFVVAFLAPLAYGVLAYSGHAAAARFFDERMLRDRTALREDLLKHGAPTEQVGDLVAYEASVAHHVSGYVSSAAFSVIGAMMFLGVTTAALAVRPRQAA